MSVPVHKVKSEWPKRTTVERDGLVIDRFDHGTQVVGTYPLDMRPARVLYLVCGNKYTRVIIERGQDAAVVERAAIDALIADFRGQP